MILANTGIRCPKPILTWVHLWNCEHICSAYLGVSLANGIRVLIDADKARIRRFLGSFWIILALRQP
jgi:hypothetical protein